MVKEIIHDEQFLSLPSEKATKEDISIAADLIDTLAANKEKCVGMAANMIGELKKIIVFDNDGTYMVMFNPVITEKSGPYETEEGCLSLSGVRKTRRYRDIKVKYQDKQFKPMFRLFSGWTAQIIQHEIDHCSGIII